MQPKHLKSVDVGESVVLAAAPVKEGGMYVAHLETPLAVYSPAVRLSLNDDGTATLSTASGTAKRFFGAVEAEVVRRVTDAHGTEGWLSETTGDALSAGFKTFIQCCGACVSGDACECTTDASWCLVVRAVQEEVAFFAADGAEVCAQDVEAGAPCRAALELTRVCFGRTTWGAMWRLKQVRLSPACSIPAEEATEGVREEAEDAPAEAEEATETEDAETEDAAARGGGGGPPDPDAVFFP